MSEKLDCELTPNPTVKEIVKDWLKSHNYDGLWCEDCGCELTDLIPCQGDGIEMCRAGYKRYLSDAGRWIIVSKPPMKAG